MSIQKSTGSGVFSATAVGSVTLGSGSYEGSNTTTMGTVSRGDKLRFIVDAFGSAQNWTVYAILGEI